MGAYKNHEFLAILEREQERDQMQLARREQEYLNSRRANKAKTKPGQKAHNTKAK